MNNKKKLLNKIKCSCIINVVIIFVLMSMIISPKLEILRRFLSAFPKQSCVARFKKIDDVCDHDLKKIRHSGLKEAKILSSQLKIKNIK